MLERITGVKLNDYFQEHIFKPLGLGNINMFPTPEMKANLVHMHQRWPTGGPAPVERDHIMYNSLRAETDEAKAKIFNSGGAGCFGKPSEYVGE